MCCYRRSAAFCLRCWMGLKRELLVHFLITLSVLVLFSWHEDNYYRTLMKKTDLIKRGEERFFYEIQNEVLELSSEVSLMKAEIDGRQDKVHNSMVSVMEAQNEIRSQLGDCGAHFIAVGKTLRSAEVILQKIGQKLLNDSDLRI